MTNENTDGMSESAMNEPERMYALLCAYVLGEVDDAERAEIEAALASSPELRAEKARIEGTIGLVQTALVKDEALSPRVRDEVLRAALPPVERRWWQESWVRAAAGILFVSFALGGWSIYEARKHAAPDCDPETGVAYLDSAAKNARGSADARKAGQLAGGVAPGESREDHTPASKRVENTLAERARANEPVVASSTDNEAPEEGTSVGFGVGARGAPVAKARGDSETTKKSTELWDAVTRDADDARQRAQPVASSGGAKEQPGEIVSYEEGVYIPHSADDAQIQQKLFKDDAGVMAVAPQAPKAEAYLPPSSAHDGTVPGGAGGGGGGAMTGSPSGPTTGAPAGPGSVPTGGPGARSSGPATGAPAALGLRGFSAEGAKAKSEAKGSAASARPTPPAESSRARSGAVAGSTVIDNNGFNGVGYVGDDALGEDAKRDDGDGGDEGDEFVEPFQFESDKRAPSLSDEDRFILGKLGMQGASTSVITPELRARYRDEYVTDWCGRILTRCRPQPNERPRDMFFRFWGDNAFEFAAVDALSTFSADVDTASYALARRYIDEGHLPAKEQVRTEEFVNYFKADVPAPESGTFAIRTTLAPSRFGVAAPDEFVARPRDLLRVVVRGRDMPKAERKPLALTFVVDCSGSMKEQNRMEMVKHAMRLLVSQLDARDSIAIVKFSTDAALVLPMTSAKDKTLIESAIHPLSADGSTNSEAGLRMGYGAAVAGLDREATNRVVFLSDGVANVGVTDPTVISDAVKPYREQGIYLNTIGVGMNNHNDVLLEQLADKGDGVCNYVDSEAEAKKVFVDDFMRSLETIARDVKIQVEFDPAQVYRYRLLGYENRAVADADFRNDKIDAGEIGSGHQVTALYEIEYARAVSDEAKLGGPRPIATVRLRYKAPRVPGATVPNEEATEIAQTILGGERTSWEGAGPGYRRATVVAQFAEFLRRSYHAKSDSYDQMLADARKLALETPDAEFASLVTLMEKAKALILNGWPASHDDLALAIDKVRENCVLRAQLERVAHERDRELLAELEVQNRQLEERLRTLLRNRLERPR